MTKISTSDIRHLAVLSGIELEDSEVQSLQLDMKNIIEYIDKLDKLDVSGVEPTYQVTGLENIMREDEIDQSEVSREQLLGLASESLDNQLKVPKVL